MGNIKTLRTGLGLDPQSADPSNPAQGQIQYADGTSRPEGLWIYDGSAWVQAGGGGGGLDVFYTNDYETTASSGFTTGLNATFDNGGTLGGAISDETSSPISGDTSVKYVTNASAGSSDNDWIASESISLDPKQQGNYAGFNFVYTWDGSDDLVEFVVWDDTNDAKLTLPTADLLKAKSNPTRFSTAVFIPSSCSAIKIGFHHTGTSESSKTLVFDDLQGSTDPFIYKDLVDRQEYVLSQASNAFSNRTDETQFDLTTATITDSGETLIVAEDDGANTRTKFIAQRKCVAHISWDGEILANRPHAIAVNGSIIAIGSANTTSGSGGMVATSVDLDAGDFITVGVAGVIRTFATNTYPSTANPKVLRIVAEALTEHVVTPARSNMLDYTEYNPTIQGAGTPTNVNVFYKQIGDAYHILGSFTPSAAQGVEAQVSLPNSKTIKSGVSITVCGTGATAGGTPPRRVFITGGDSFLNFADNGLAPENGSAVFQAGFGFSFECLVPIEGLSSEAQFLAAIPVQKTAYIKEVVVGGGSAGTFTSGTWQTRNLTTTSGDTEIVNLNSNQFTLQAGKYEITASAPALDVNAHQVRLQNITDASTVELGTTEYATNGGSDASRSFVETSIKITSAKTFELQHQCANTQATNGFGNIGGFGDDVYATIKITKIK